MTTLLSRRVSPARSCSDVRAAKRPKPMCDGTQLLVRSSECARSLAARVRLLRALVLLGVALLLSRPCAAQAQPASDPGEMAHTQTIRECAEHRDKGQTLRVDGHWLEARRALQGCAAERCPIAIRSECQSWIDQLSTAIPSVVFVVEGDTQNAAPARVFVDGETDPARAYPAETPIELEPGEHQFRVELPPHASKKFTLALTEGERHRLVRVRFARETPSLPTAQAQEPPPPVAAQTTTPAEPVPDRSLRTSSQVSTPWLSYGLGLGAIVGIASATGIYVAAKSELDSARQTCAPLCSSEKRESIESMLLLGDVVGVASLLLGAAAVYFYETAPDAKAAYGQSSIDLAVGRRSAGLSLRHAF